MRGAAAGIGFGTLEGPQAISARQTINERPAERGKILAGMVLDCR